MQKQVHNQRMTRVILNSFQDLILCTLLYPFHPSCKGQLLPMTNLELPEFNFCPVCGAPVKVIHREGRNRPVCTSCGHVVYVNPYPAAALVLLNDRQVLTLRSMEPKSGEWCLPGGFLEWGESPEEGARRELLEETGITAGNISIIGAYDSITGARRHVLLLAYRVHDWRGEPKAGDDAAEVRWFDMGNTPPLAFRVHEEVLLDVMKADGGT
jgi:8-oxo-dGTP diphosphatase